MMASIAATAERELPYGRWLAERGPQANNQYHAIAFGAVGAVYQLGLKCIVSPTNTGTTAMLISAYRPRAPVLALSPRREVVRRCQLLWGVHPRLNEEPLDTLGLIEACADAACRGRASPSRATRSASRPGCPPGARAARTCSRSTRSSSGRRLARRSASRGASSAASARAARRRSRNARAFSMLPQSSIRHQRPERFFEWS